MSSVDTVNHSNNLNNNAMFDEWTRIHNDSASISQQDDLSTKPMKYYANSFNNISGTNDKYLAFTPIGQAQFSAVPNVYDRAIPSNLNRGHSSVYTPPMSTSAFLGSSNGVNPLETDLDLTLKTGLTLRSKRSDNDVSAIKFPHYGDLAVKAEVVQNAGQFWDNKLSNRFNQDILGLNESMSITSQGAGGNYTLFSNQAGISTRNAMINYQNPGGKSGAQIKPDN